MNGCLITIFICSSDWSLIYHYTISMHVIGHLFYHYIISMHAIGHYSMAISIHVPDMVKAAWLKLSIGQKCMASFSNAYVLVSTACLVTMVTCSILRTEYQLLNLLGQNIRLWIQDTN